MEHLILKRKIKHLLSGGIFAMLLLVMSILLKSQKPMEDPTPEIRPLYNHSYSVYDECVESVEGNGTPNKDYNHLHIASAKQTGVCSIQDTAALQQLVENNHLIEVKEDQGFRLAELTHSFPYLTESSVLTLRKIGASFYAASGDQSAFTVSSIARTEQTQKKLRRSNANASKSESSHTFGVSFDISYIRYNGERAWNYEYTKALEGILATMQKNGEIYVLKERNQSCFHITVR